MGRHLRAIAALGLVLAAGLAGCCRPGAGAPERAPAGPKPTGPATVWVVDDGERIVSRAGVLRAMSGSAIWSPGKPVKLFGLPGETISFQAVVTAGDKSLLGVEVDVAAFRKGDAALKERTERFVVSELDMPARSGGKDPGESLGWSLGSMPPDASVAGLIPDPLIPTEHAQPWADYPMSVTAGSHRVVWFDLSIPERGPSRGDYTSEIVVTQREAGSSKEMARIPIVVEVGDKELPWAAARTMVYVDPSEIKGRVGSADAVDRAFQMLHAHRLGIVVPIKSAGDVGELRDMLTGRLYDADRGYAGPGAGGATDVVAIGTYGDLGAATPESVGTLRDILAALSSLGIHDDPGKTDVFVYAADESCDDARGAGWRDAIRAAGDLRVRVGWTCSESPSAQPVDIPIMFASSYDTGLAQAARGAGKQVWIYNGQLPATGSFLTDSWTVSLRANAWIQALYGIDRWFYWETAFWNDDNRGGKGPYDPLATAETFHNQHGDHCNGDGVLLYPGAQKQSGFRSAGWDGVFPSIRLKQWRRGIQDAGYLQLARLVDRGKADEIARGLVGNSLSHAKGGKPGWPTEARAWVEARRALFDMIEGR